MHSSAPPSEIGNPDGSHTCADHQTDDDQGTSIASHSSKGTGGSPGSSSDARTVRTRCRARLSIAPFGNWTDFNAGPGSCAVARAAGPSTAAAIALTRIANVI